MYSKFRAWFVQSKKARKRQKNYLEEFNEKNIL
jgi:hypothetical protein